LTVDPMVILCAFQRQGNQPEGPTGAQCQMRHLQLVQHAAHQQTFIAPVKLEGFTQLEAQGHERFRAGFTRQLAPGAGEVSHCAVATPVLLRLDLNKQRFGCAPAVLGSIGVGRKGLLQRCFKGGELGSANPSSLRDWHAPSPTYVQLRLTRQNPLEPYRQSVLSVKPMLGFS